MNKKLVAALFAAGAVSLFFARMGGASAAPGHEAHGGGHAMTCPAHVEGAEVKVTNTKDGVVINITAKDPGAVKMIQVAAAHMGMKEAGCAHCGQKAAPGQKKAQAAQGQTKEDVYVCSMGCYKGPKTKDGRCPKCGMNLEKQ
ncbi:MAG: hypothetical protein HZB91_03085 [Elusimicrobia bacterium]|nr:hypothetical protein [Elusimicrobiota bacterium]